MSPPEQRVRELDFFSTPPPPPLPPKDLPSRSPVSKGSVTLSSPSHIKRKPLPNTAFPPHSTQASPDSIFSQYRDTPRQIATPSSVTALNNILISPPRQLGRKEILHPEDRPPTPTDKKTQSFRDPQSPEYTGPSVSINDFPVPPRSVSLALPKSNEGSFIVPRKEVGMGVRNNERPPPLRMESLKAVKSLDAKKPQSPGSVFTSFFSRKQNALQTISPSGESSITDISESRSGAPSPYPRSMEDVPMYYSQALPSTTDESRHASPQSSLNSIQYDEVKILGYGSPTTNDVMARCSSLENELREISKELAGSIRRELDLEDLVDRLQSAAPTMSMSVDRTSDYFSDSGTSSVRQSDNAMSTKEEIEKIRRDSDQQRAQIRVALSRKWQDEVAQRKALESHVSVLESKLSQTRKEISDPLDPSTRIRELESTLDDTRRRLNEERQTKENFEDLFTALKADFEQHRNDRDNLRDEIVPNLRSQIEGLESSLAETQKQSYESARMQQEIQSLRDENAAISSARKMEQEMIRSGMEQIAEDDDLSSIRSSLVLPKSGGLNRSNTVAGRTTTKGTLSRSGSLSRANSIIVRPMPDTPESVTDKLNAVEQQRDALHATAKHLRKRLEHENKRYEKRIATMQILADKAKDGAEASRRGGYEKEVRNLRHEINLLRKRADEALDQKWQCEKGLSGLKMDLDRSKQETASLQKLLQARDIDDPEALSNSLEHAINDLQQARAQSSDSMQFLKQEQELAEQLEQSAKRSEVLATQVRSQLEANSSLRVRLINAVESGENNQQASAAQINQLQSKLKRLEDTITSAQTQSETAVMIHEDELRDLKESHNAQLQRAKEGLKSPNPNSSSARSPLSPMFANSKRSPKLDHTTSGPGQTLNQSLKTEFLENKVTELEKALHDAEHGMEEVVGRMNQAQIGVFELQQERDEALKKTRKLEADVRAERERFQMLVTGGLGISDDST